MSQSSIVITVKQKHIDLGNAQTSDRCAISLALKEHFKGPERIIVAVKEIMFMTKDEMLVSKLPPEAVQFNKDSCARRPVKPFIFEIT